MMKRTAFYLFACKYSTLLRGEISVFATKEKAKCYGSVIPLLYGFTETTCYIL